MLYITMNLYDNIYHEKVALLCCVQFYTDILKSREVGFPVTMGHTHIYKEWYTALPNKAMQ